MREPIFVSETVHDEAVVMDADGKVLHNAMQQGVPVVRRIDSEGKSHLTRQDDGAYIVPPFDPADFDFRPLCQHCGERPW